MKKILFFTLSVILINSIYSQKIPSVKVGDSLKLKLSSLNVDIVITGKTAVTTYDMYFFNELERTLEGELSFPLADGQSVSRFAMEVNGSLREAVIVEKELGRVAFESTVRQNIDPALLTKTQGNNYKTRVYPLLPKKNKRVIVSYEEELNFDEKSKRYTLPLILKKSLDKFSISINILKQKEMPLIKGYDNLNFKKVGANFELSKKWKKFEPINSLEIELPVNKRDLSPTFYKEYFNISGFLSPKSKLKPKPKHIQLLWDTSYSMNLGNRDLEFQLLDKYFKYLNEVEVTLVFLNLSNQNEIKYKVKNGNWNKIKESLSAVKYDGATSYKMLSDKCNCDETLLFSDGLANFNKNIENFKTPIYIISSKTSADYNFLKKIAQNSGGNYLNLLKVDTEKALNKLSNENYKFLGIKNNKNISEVYPKKNTTIIGPFSISGKFKNNTSVELLFGYGNKVEDRFKIDLNKDSNNSPLIRRLWAKQKLIYLTQEKEKNKKKIIALGKSFKLVTDYTSMIILDRVEDYVKYNIEPPVELRKQYKELVEKQKKDDLNQEEELAELQEDLKKSYAKLKEWYKINWDSIFKAKIKEEKRKQLLIIKRRQDSIIKVQKVKDSLFKVKIELENKQKLDSIYKVKQRIKLKEKQDSLINLINTNKISKRGHTTISGIVSTHGLPLPGVEIKVKGKNTYSITNFDGIYTIDIQTGDTLVFSSLGFTTSEFLVNNRNRLDVILTEDIKVLDETVVVGYGTRKLEDIVGSVVSVKVEDIEKVHTMSFEQALVAKAPGVRVVQSNGGPGAGLQVCVRGNTSFLAPSEPLYVIDGFPVIDNSNNNLGIGSSGSPLANIDPSNIESVSVLKDASATSIYGARGVNGVVIITTKSGKKENAEAITSLQKKINDKITLKPRDPNQKFIADLKIQKTDIEAYHKYLEIRSEYSNVPTFYLDISDFFITRNNKELALLVLSNLIEVDLDNYELLRAFAYKLEYLNRYDLAVEVYQKILELRPEDPQSYRDLALAYQAESKYQKSFDLLYQIYDGTIMLKDENSKYEGIEEICYVELMHLLAKYRKEIKLDKAQKKELSKIESIDTDIRVVIDWNHNETDMDLWVIDPNGEKCFYSHDKTKIGGKLSKDFTEGFGPEEFMLKKAIKGNYKVILNYFGDQSQKISGPAIVKATVFLNYGKSNQEKRVVIFQSDKKEEIEIAEFKI